MNNFGTTKSMGINKALQSRAFVAITTTNKQQVNTVENLLSHQRELIEKTKLDISVRH